MGDFVSDPHTLYYLARVWETVAAERTNLQTHFINGYFIITERFEENRVKIEIFSQTRLLPIIVVLSIEVLRNIKKERRRFYKRGIGYYVCIHGSEIFLGLSAKEAKSRIFDIRRSLLALRV